VAAKDGKAWLDRASNMIADLEAERQYTVGPYNAAVKEINNKYRAPRFALDSLKEILKTRLETFIREERARREAEAEAARQLALEAGKLAREAEEKEREAIAEAASGVVVDIAASTAAADQAFQSFQKAERIAARADKDADFLLSGGTKRRMGLKTKEILVLHNWHKAIDEMGLSEVLIEAILKEARAFRKQHGRLPNGIVFTTEEVL